MPTNYKQVFAMKTKIKKRLLFVNPMLNNSSGIYFLTRCDENGIKHAYVGQAKHVTDRLVSHMCGYSQHIDLSLRKHGLYSAENPHGWKVNFLNFPENLLNEKERCFIQQYARKGYQMKNVDTGGGAGKQAISERRPARSYREGVDAGYKKASREIAHLFNLHLVYKPAKDPPTQNQLKAAEKFKAFLEYHLNS